MTTWDEAKRRRNLLKHGVDLAIAMPKKSRLTPNELKTVRQLRVQAHEKARRIAKLSLKEDATLYAAASSDPDNPPLSEKEWRRMRPAHEVRPELVAKQLRPVEVGPKSAETKQQVTLRIDRDVLEKFRSTGEGWQSRINAALRKAKV